MVGFISVGYFSFLVLLSLLFFYASSDYSFSIGFLLNSFSLVGDSSYFIVDNYSLVCIFMLLVCGLTVLPFVFHYMGYSFLGGVLFYLVILFIFVMGCLIFSGDYIFTLVCWEYLGLVSYLLIIFLCNLGSVRAALITLFASRFGDVSLFLLAGLGFYWFNLSWFYSLLILLVVLTKSACFPFTSWLLEAMRAPTPVSCLVHSSTLVAAGVWFSYRYGNFFSDGTMEVLFVLSIFTVIITAFSALFFTDLKKLVALSTCNNISWCVLCFSLGDFNTSLLFLLTHGVSKCLLFIIVGDVMSSSGGSQSGLGVYLSRYSSFWISCVSLVLLTCLCGLPFMGVFLSKHLLISSASLSYSSFLYYLCCFCVCLSFSYTYRFAFLLLSRVGGLSLGVISEFFLCCFIILLPNLVAFIGSGSFIDLVAFSSFYSVTSLFFSIHLVGLFMGCFFYFFSSSLSCVSSWPGSLWGSDYLVCLVYSIGIHMSNLFYCACYRWEVSFLYTLSLFFNRFSSHSFGSSINVSILGLLWIVVLFFISFS